MLSSVYECACAGVSLGAMTSPNLNAHHHFRTYWIFCASSSSIVRVVSKKNDRKHTRQFILNLVLMFLSTYSEKLCCKFPGHHGCGICRKCSCECWPQPSIQTSYTKLSMNLQKDNQTHTCKVKKQTPAPQVSDESILLILPSLDCRRDFYWNLDQVPFVSLS